LLFSGTYTKKITDTLSYIYLKPRICGPNSNKKLRDMQLSTAIWLDGERAFLLDVQIT